jgi:hypothetical protein
MRKRGEEVSGKENMENWFISSCNSKCDGSLVHRFPVPLIY